MCGHIAARSQRDQHKNTIRAALIDKIFPSLPASPSVVQTYQGCQGYWIAVRSVRGEDVARIRVSFTLCCTQSQSKTVKSLGFEQGYLTSLTHLAWFAYFSFRFCSVYGIPTVQYTMFVGFPLCGHKWNRCIGNEPKPLRCPQEAKT